MNNGRKLVAALACRNTGSRLYGKPLQNLDVEQKIHILDNIIESLNMSECIDEVVLGISKGIENEIFIEYANSNDLKYVIGDEEDVLSRLIMCGEISNATDIFRVTSESPFRYFESEIDAWNKHQEAENDATFLEGIVDGCGFEIIKLSALKVSHENGESKHRSEMCTLYIRENPDQFKIKKILPSKELIRPDLRLTVDNPEDLVVCRKIYAKFKHLAPMIPIADIVSYLDQNPELIQLTLPFTEQGYSSMYL
ncbi:acylneuraminate cytidylyltransferase [Candidatus Thioglobus sp.]|nr:acylneuraminate cytidylyltransferase [Candidatus Thioglobus sp.]